MHQLTQSVTEKRSWLLGSTTTSASLNSTANSEQLSAEQITEFTTALLLELKEIIPSLATRIGDQESLLNLRGRPEESFTERSTALRQKQEELCFIAGDISLPLEEELEQKEFESIPFTLAINTKFEKITAKEITHRVSFSPTGGLVQWRDSLSAATFTKASLLKIITFRLGFEYFAPSLFGSMLGTIPTIRSRFYLSISADGLSLHIASQEKDSSPFSTKQLLEVIRRLLPAISASLIS